MLSGGQPSAPAARRGCNGPQRERGYTRRHAIVTLAALHDLNLAARFSDRILLLDHGRIIGLGEPPSIVTDRMLSQVYGLNCEIIVLDEGRLGV